MVCKNCEKALRTDYSYCPDCGAKVIRNRITVKNLWHDIVDRYFNIDNTFLKTIIHLIVKPEIVIEGYIRGTRRKYLNPISLLGIALTLSGYLLFLMKKGADKIDFDVFGMGVQTIAQQKVLDFTLEYSSIFFILYIPLMAISAWLCFDKKKYNFSERIIIFLYAMGGYSLITLIPSILILSVTPKFYAVYSFMNLGIMYIYCLYVIKRVSQEKGLSYWAKGTLFCILFTMLYFGLSIAAITVFLLITDQIDIKDFLPVKT